MSAHKRSKTERIEELERELALLRARLAAVEARPVSVPLPSSPYYPAPWQPTWTRPAVITTIASQANEGLGKLIAFNVREHIGRAVS